MIKVYLAHPISTTGEFNDSVRVARRIEQLHNDGEQLYDVYAPALNKAINDKSNNPTPAMIYDQDVDNLLDADVVVVNYTGGDADGTVLEIGLLAGMYEAGAKDLPAVYVYSSNKRALQPQFWDDVPSGKLNHMVLGAVEKHFKWCGEEESMIQALASVEEV